MNTPSKNTIRPGRRAVLRGIGGIAVGLPMLDLFEKRAHAAGPPVYAFFMVGGNGVMQSWPFHEAAEKVETFWPTLGETDGVPDGGPFQYALTREQLLADKAKRTTGEFHEYAEKLLLLKGIDHPAKLGGGCPHHRGNQLVLTAARVSSGGSFQNQLAQGESIDNRIAREMNPKGSGPLSLHVGLTRAGGTGHGYPSFVSHAGPNRPNPVEASPATAYGRMMGISELAPEVAAKLTKGRQSVNDLLRGEMKRLLARPGLSQADKNRLDQHFTSIRDIEVKLGGALAPETLEAMKAVNGQERDNANHARVMRLHLDLVAFAFASDYTRAATLKCGDVNDRVRVNIDGTLQPVFHMISHRVLSDGAGGPAIANAQALHAKIDRVYASHFKYFLDKIRDIDTPHGKLIDQGAFVWTNQIANGKYHSMRDAPWVIVGNARGYLKSGQFINFSAFRDGDGKRHIKNNRILNTLLNAAGVRKAGGAPVDDFGDPELTKGILPEIVRT